MDVISLPTVAILIVTSCHSRPKQVECVCMPKGMPKNFTLLLASRNNERKSFLLVDLLWPS